MVASVEDITFNPNDLLYFDRRRFLPVPKYWSRLYVGERRNWSSNDEVRLTEWIQSNVGGLWAVHSYEFLDGSSDSKSHYTRRRKMWVVISFEDPNDKLMFEMMGGLSSIT